MGRLTKTKVDQIARLRKQGYTQKETAEKVNVNLRTVRKYDPLRENRPREGMPLEDRMTAVEDGVRTCWDMLHILHRVMLESEELNNILEERSLTCPRCGEELFFDGLELAHICCNCDFQMPMFLKVCYKCLSREEVDSDENDPICSKCGTPLYTPYERAC